MAYMRQDHSIKGWGHQCVKLGHMRSLHYLDLVGRKEGCYCLGKELNQRERSERAQYIPSLHFVHKDYCLGGLKPYQDTKGW